MQKDESTRSLESWLWDAACSIRGEIEAPKYKDFIIPLIFLKRLNDVFEDELLNVSPNREKALIKVETDHRLVRFYIPEKATYIRLTGNPRGGLTPAAHSLDFQPAVEVFPSLSFVFGNLTL